jgi:signal transduction histidine kinase
MVRRSAPTSVWLGLSYSALFVASSLLLLGMLWWRAAGNFDRWNDAAIKTDSAEIGDQLRHGGIPGAVESIRVHIAEIGGATAVYLLADARLKPLAGNLASWPNDAGPTPGWYWIQLPRDGRLHSFRLLRTSLSKGLNLLVGRAIVDRADSRILIIDTLYWVLVTGLALALGGGLLVHKAVLRRVAMINDAATAIVQGNLARRIPMGSSQDAFDRLALTINTMLQQIQQLVEGIKNTSNAVAHDLRTPLAELRARLEELLRTQPPPATTFAEIHQSVADIDRVIAIFNALLRLAEIDSGVRRAGFRHVELSGLAIDIAELYAPLADEKQASLVVDAPASQSVNGDPHLLAQAVGNLVDNAVKYIPCGGEVSVRIARADAGWIEIVVADNGPGIAEPEKGLVTGRFYRCRREVGETGIGLGLSLVDAVARLHQGSLILTDNHPGLVATLRLPDLSLVSRPSPTVASPLPA